MEGDVCVRAFFARILRGMRTSKGRKISMAFMRMPSPTKTLNFKLKGGGRKGTKRIPDWPYQLDQFFVQTTSAAKTVLTTSRLLK